ncbi:unnamed protein product [Polarella glacialis]|uniref:SMP-LTD domain-containing protein n=1 Tax=Polarella glacialis TaxID=89957 RepID=A0A813LDE3_POLGL|nr:unnamed protein product [Polarella glacialis]
MRSQKSFVEPSRDPRSRWRQVVAQLSSCGSSCGKGLPCRRSFGFRRSLGHLALRLCGSCSSYVQTAGPRANLLPSTGLTPKHAALVNGELLLNDLVEKLWPKISEWFQQQLKEQLEPVLKKHVLESLEFEECTLGTAPLELHDITTETYIQDWQGDPWTNIKITGDLDYCGDGEIRVSLRPGGHKVADILVWPNHVIQIAAHSKDNKTTAKQQASHNKL